MTDTFSRKQRSKIMSRVKSRGNKNTELLMISIMRAHKIKNWRRNSPVFGKPDFVFAAQKVALFIDGCFWHGCKRHGQIPKSNRQFWAAKLRRNQARDKLVGQTLGKLGWRVVRIWQHELRDSDKIAARIRRFVGKE